MTQVNKEKPVSDAKPYYKITPWHDECTGELLWYVDGPTGRVTCHSEGEAAFAFMLLESAYSSGAASRDGEVGRYKAALEEIAQDEASGYGHYHGGDPRMFHPDSESCTPEELASHKKACDEWTEAENAAKPPPDAPCPSGWITPNIHVTASQFGIGCYTYPSHTAEIARSALAPGNGGEVSKTPYVKPTRL